MRGDGELPEPVEEVVGEVDGVEGVDGVEEVGAEVVDGEVVE